MDKVKIMIVSSSFKNIYIHCDVNKWLYQFREDIEILKAMTDMDEIFKFVQYLYEKYKDHPIIKGITHKMIRYKNINDLLNYVDKIDQHSPSILL